MAAVTFGRADMLKFYRVLLHLYPPRFGKSTRKRWNRSFGMN